jgi:hypothetical protein
VKYHYSERCFAHRIEWERQPLLTQSGSIRWAVAYPIREQNMGFSLCDPLLRDICQMGSLAGAAYLLKSNAGVLRHTQ